MAKQETGLMTTAQEIQRLASEGEALQIFGRGTGGIETTLQAAQVIKRLDELFDTPEVQVAVVNLQGKPYGFRTDQDRPSKSNPNPKPYPYPVVKAACIQALLQGVNLHGNQMNIISQSCYITQEGFTQKLDALDELRDYTITPDIPHVVEGKGAIVTVRIRATTTDGARIDEERKYAIRGSTADQIIGKADRKAKKWLWEHITHNTLPADPDDMTTTVDVSATITDADEPATKTATKPKVDIRAALIEAGAGEADVDAWLATVTPLEQSAMGAAGAKQAFGRWLDTKGG